MPVQAGSTTQQTSDERSWTASRVASARLSDVVPGGAHTYARGEDQYPAGMAPIIVRGHGSHVVDVDGHEYVEYGSGLRSVSLGHAHPGVVEAAVRAMRAGTSFVRPSVLELEAAESLLSLLPRAEMVKFTKNGSDATTAAVRLARAVTGRDVVAVCRDQPFFSTDDWFVGGTAMSAGIPAAVRELTVSFPFDDLDGLTAVLDRHDDRVACIVLEGAASTEPSPGYLGAVRLLCDERGILLVLDEMITGFRWANGGAQEVYDVEPDLSTFGKALGNGLAISALAGKRRYMQRGGYDHGEDRVFLLSSTHGAETSGLAAAIAVIAAYREGPVIETMYARGARLRAGVQEAASAAGVSEHVQVLGRDCNLVYATLDADGQRSQPFRTLFLQELLRRGVLAPSFVVGAAHTEVDIDATVAAVHEACLVYRRALTEGVDRHLEGRPVRPVFRPR
jgi:glutamate-1-semialdehyde 2,1-aminomutase